MYTTIAPSRKARSSNSRTLSPTRGLWKGHEATPHQRSLFDQLGDQPKKPTQRDLILAALRQARADNRALQLPQIMALHIAQHSARLRELRLLGHKIENRMRRAEDGTVHSEYELTYDVERDPAVQG